MKSFMKEFKEFVAKGNVMMIAVGMLIGAAFSSVVTSFTDNILSPVLGLFVGANFDALGCEVFGVTIQYGAFITSVINFLILAVVIFMMIKGMNRLMEAGKHENASAEESPARTCKYCMTEIHADATRCPACTSQLE